MLTLFGLNVWKLRPALFDLVAARLLISALSSRQNILDIQSDERPGHIKDRSPLVTRKRKTFDWILVLEVILDHQRARSQVIGWCCIRQS